MALHRSTVIAIEALDVCNPVSLEIIDQAVRLTGLGPGARVLDLGCGNAFMSIHLAETFGFVIDAVERDAAVFEIASARAAGRGAPGEVRLHNVDSKAFLEAAEPYDLLIAAGADRMSAASAEPSVFLTELARHVRPGGFVLWADAIWSQPPDAGYQALVESTGIVYRSYVECVAAGENAGMKCWYAVESPQEAWDDCAWRVATASQIWLDNNPGHPEALSVRQQSEFIRGIYVVKARGVLGFATFLFRMPAAT
ncbi:class I SAM-dependent methyltransferase [soil metagenome]